MPSGPGAPPGPPAAPTKDQAAKNILEQGKKRPPVGFDSTILGNNSSSSVNAANLSKSTLLGG